MKLSACIEWLFADEVENFADRIAACARFGIQAVEFHLWRDKDLDAIEAALKDTGVELVAFANDPRRHLTKREMHAEFFRDFAAALQVAQRLNAAAVLATIGPAATDRPRAEQRSAVIAAFSQAARMAQDAGTYVFIEALNSVVDHPGFFLTSGAEALDIVEEVGQPSMKALYDIYHSVMMGEDPRSILAGRMQHVGHVQVADAPDRHEPGTGHIDWGAQLRTLEELGYSGPIGLEYKPSGSTTESLSRTRSALGLPGRRIA